MESTSKLETVDLEFNEIFESYSNDTVDSSSHDFNDWLKNRISSDSKQKLHSR